jgi:hypothetical protein
MAAHPTAPAEASLLDDAQAWGMTSRQELESLALDARKVMNCWKMSVKAVMMWVLIFL